jgi:ribosomal protein L16 Arg81 hydroxylase
MFTPNIAWSTVFMWIGGAGAATGIHSDDENNILAQVRGRKRVRVWPPSQAQCLYPNDKYDSGTICCDVNPEAPDLAAHPRFQEADGFVVTLEPGDGIYIPKYWWHCTKSETASVSINYFASTWWEWLTVGIARIVGEWLHNLGLYRRGNCVCHSVA